METTLKSVRNKFTTLTILIAMICAAVGALSVYIVSNIHTSNQIDAQVITELADDNDALLAYLEQQEPFHAHFETVASLAVNHEQSQLAQTLPILLMLSFIISGVLGWILAQKFLSPVRDAYSSQRRFMQDAAHELRNPLAAIQSTVQQALTQKANNPKNTKLLKRIDFQATQLAAITTDLLLLERKEQPAKQLTDIAALLEDVLEELHHKAKKHKVTIKKKSPKTVLANIDPQHFVYIANNVIDNAIKFSANSKKPIHINLKSDKSHWELVVTDSGIGIPEEDIAHITQRFYRAKNTTHTEGTGLGMTIVAKYVELYRGTLQIISTPQRGTTIRIKC